LEVIDTRFGSDKDNSDAVKRFQPPRQTSSKESKPKDRRIFTEFNDKTRKHNKEEGNQSQGRKGGRTLL
jgi:hypothetical protein